MGRKSQCMFFPSVLDWLWEDGGGEVGKGTRNTFTIGSPYPPDFTPEIGFLHSCKYFQQKCSLDCKTACLSPQDTKPPTMLLNEHVLLVFLKGYRFAGIYLSRITWPETYGIMPETEIFNLQQMWWGAVSEWRASLLHPKTAVPVLCNLSGNPHLRSWILKCPIDKIPVHKKDAVCGNMQENGSP